MIRTVSGSWLLFISCMASAQQLVPVDLGWAGNSVNTAVFRKNSLASFKDTQFIAFYNADGYVVVGKRDVNFNHGQLRQTLYKGKTTDAHNAISIGVDGDGYLHMAWDHHNSQLRYCKSVSPGALDLTNELPMTGKLETKVSYPEFHRLPDGNLLFFYRDGSSGSGNMVINKYDIGTRTWTQLHHNLIDGEKLRNAYWQACVDMNGAIHLSWVWRESPDVASNHDLCYARSDDGGVTWKKSDDQVYLLPITAATAEYACRIPQGQALINQTSMTTDEEGNPFIAAYWRDSGSAVPQYHVIYKNEKGWEVINAGFRKKAFSLGGTGTKRIPISRPQILTWRERGLRRVGIIFRDEERGNKVSVALNKNLEKNSWKVHDLLNNDVGSWEPTYDTDLWLQRRIVHLFVQKTDQTDAEGISILAPQMISILQWDLKQR